MTVPTIFPSLVSSIALVIVFGWLFAVHRERFLLIWTLAWLLWVVRYAYGLASGDLFLGAEELVLPALVIGRSLLMVWGAYELTRHPLSRRWVAAFAAATAWLVVETSLGLHEAGSRVRGVEYYGLFAAALVWAGVLFLRAERGRGPERVLAGFGLIAFGVIQLSFPFGDLLPSWYGPVGFTTAHALQITIGLGVVMAYMRRARAEAEDLSDRLASTLTRVLADHLPICAHCKSIRNDEGEWARLEAYVHGTTGSRFSHGICPNCVEEHYGPEAMGLPSPAGD